MERMRFDQGASRLHEVIERTDRLMMLMEDNRDTRSEWAPVTLRRLPKEMLLPEELRLAMLSNWEHPPTRGHLFIMVHLVVSIV
jgi:hypothetical protein